MPLLSVTSLYKDRNGEVPIDPPLLLCSLLQAEPISSGNLLHVVLTALQSLKKLFLWVPPLNQFKPICVSPKTTLQSLQGTALQKSLPSLWAAKPSVPSRLEQNSPLSNPVSMVSVGSCCHRPAGGGAMTPGHR